MVIAVACWEHGEQVQFDATGKNFLIVSDFLSPFPSLFIFCSPISFSHNKMVCAQHKEMNKFDHSDEVFCLLVRFKNSTGRFDRKLMQFVRFTVSSKPRVPFTFSCLRLRTVIRKNYAKICKQFQR